MIKNKVNIVFLLFAEMIFLISCSNHGNETKSIHDNMQNFADSNDNVSNIWFSDTSEDFYDFHPNRKLYCYVNMINSKMNGQAVYFYKEGGVSGIRGCKKGKKHGMTHIFYPSGNLESSWHYENDSLKGYQISYYDRFNYKKSEEMAAPKSKKSYVYKRIYDSATQKIIEDHDHRIEWLKENPEINPKSLQMPEEDDDWYQK